MKRLNYTISWFNGIGYCFVLFVCLVCHMWVDALMAFICILIAHRMLASLEKEHGKLHRAPEESDL